MFPFSSLLEGINNELRVPGQDSPVTYNAFNSWPNAAVAGVQFRASGVLYRKTNTNVLAQTDMWIHGDMWNIVDASLYEARYTSVTGNVSDISGNLVDTWYSCDTEPRWDLVALAGEFGFAFKNVQGTIQVREIANPTNIRSGDLTLDADFEGLS